MGLEKGLVYKIGFSRPVYAAYFRRVSRWAREG
jgi:hypothetical protein